MVALATMLVSGCASSNEFEAIKTQLSEIELQILQLQKQAPSKDEISALEASLSSRVDSILEAGAEMRADLRSLAEQIDQLEAKLEDGVYRLQQLSQQIAATNQELKAVRSAAEEARASVTARPPPAANSADPRALYDTAYNDYLQGSFDLAILGFQQYLETFPDTELTDNAIYWIGECFYRQGKFQKAIEQFGAVLLRFPDSDRTASALLKKGYAHLELGQRAQGVVNLQSVICEHASTDEASLASQRLQEMGIDVEC